MKIYRLVLLNKVIRTIESTQTQALKAFKQRLKGRYCDTQIDKARAGEAQIYRHALKIIKRIADDESAPPPLLKALHRTQTALLRARHSPWKQISFVNAYLNVFGKRTLQDLKDFSEALSQQYFQVIVNFNRFLRRKGRAEERIMSQKKLAM